MNWDEFLRLAAMNFVWVIGLMVLLYMFVPIFIVVLMSFNDPASRVGYRFDGFGVGGIGAIVNVKITHPIYNMMLLLICGGAIVFERPDAAVPDACEARLFCDIHDEARKQVAGLPCPLS